MSPELQPAAVRFSSDICSALLSPQQWEGFGQRFALSPDDMHLLQRLFDEDSEHKLAAAGGVSVRVLRARLSRLFSRLKVSNRAHLVLRVLAEQHAVGSPCPMVVPVDRRPALLSA